MSTEPLDVAAALAPLRYNTFVTTEDLATAAINALRASRETARYHRRQILLRHASGQAAASTPETPPAVPAQGDAP